LQKTTAGTAGVQLRRSPAGRITLLEELYSPRAPLWIYGAGHVGQALVRLLMNLDLYEIRWIDSRSALLPAALPQSVTAQASPVPAATVAGAPPQCRFVVLTHDHALDYALCRAVLERGDAAWLGLIGSQSKAARFRSRLSRDGIERRQLASLACPIGLGGRSKRPDAIAISIAAQLLQLQPDTTRTADAHAPAATGCAADCAGCPAPWAAGT
jgi:xanthine dehydrogenase accessory factor